MSLSTKMKNAAVGELPDSDVEAALRQQLAPLISFLEQAQAFDDGYPDQFPADQRVAGEAYREDGLNIDNIGCTLEHSVDFSNIPEITDGREGQGRYLGISISVKEHALHGENPLLTKVDLFESGKIRFWPQEYEVTRDADIEADILAILKITLQGYLQNSVQYGLTSFHEEDILNSGAYKRTKALAELAAQIYNDAYSPDTPAQAQQWLPK